MAMGPDQLDINRKPPFKQHWAVWSGDAHRSIDVQPLRSFW